LEGEAERGSAAKLQFQHDQHNLWAVPGSGGAPGPNPSARTLAACRTGAHPNAVVEEAGDFPLFGRAPAPLAAGLGLDRACSRRIAEPRAAGAGSGFDHP
jgi:hypothetical protein